MLFKLSFSVTLLALPCMVGTSNAVSLDVMTFNIRGDFDQGRATEKAEAWISLVGKHRRDLLLQVLADQQFDLLGVQEAYENQVRELKDALPEFGFYGVGRDDGNTAGEFSGVFYRKDRFQKLGDGTFWLSETPDEVGSQHPDAACVRIASWLILSDRQAGDRRYLVVNTHWDHVSQPARLVSARVIRQKIGQLADGGAVIVMGDLNVDENNPALRSLLSENDLALMDGYRQVHPQPSEIEATYHGFRGETIGKRIDYVLVSDDFRATDAEIVRTDVDGVFPSDHFPVRVTLELVR